MPVNDSKTKIQILNAAKDIFIKKGYSAARTQEIADKAGVNKAAIHYYFSNKENLFKIVFQETFIQMFEGINIIINDKRSFVDKIEDFVNLYISFIKKNTLIIPFIISEINMNPIKFSEFIEKVSAFLNKEKLFSQIKDDIQKGKIKDISPFHLFVNIISLCVYPFLVRPIVSGLLNNKKNFIDKFYNERKKEITKFIFDAVKK